VVDHGLTAAKHNIRLLVPAYLTFLLQSETAAFGQFNRSGSIAATVSISRVYFVQLLCDG